MNLLEGKSIAENMLERIKEKVSENIYKPRLDIFLIGDDFASKKYVEIKEKTAKEVGIRVVVHQYDVDVSEDSLVTQIQDLSLTPDVNGIMVQLPLPENLDVNNIVNAIDPGKDVDGLSAFNIGKAFTNDPSQFLSGTARAIKELLAAYQVEIKGKNICVVGASREVGIPLSGMFLSLGATVTVCHKLSNDIEEFSSESDILVSATGVPGLITGEFVKEGAVVVDVGFSMKEGRLSGDVDFESVKTKASAITPVPGGIGPITVASLLANTLDAFIFQNNV